MTEKQKKAILILNRLHQQFRVSIFNDEDYFLLMEFVVGGKEPQISYIPFTLTDPKPLDPIYGKFGPVTCNQKVEEQDAYEQGYKDAFKMAYKWLIERYDNQGVILIDDIHELYEKMEE